jgi:type IX secretion system substrate protein
LTNGRDWWIIAQKDSSDIVYKILLTPNGIQNITTQHLGYSQFFMGNVSQITFSQDGTKFIQTNYYYAGSSHPSFIVIADFDRCSGMFSNTQTVQLTNDSFLPGLALSPSGQYAYTCDINYIFQINTSTLAVDTVATYDGFYYPIPGAATTFFNMFLAANGKIYITSASSVQHIHEMNYPDSAGTACDVQQHAIFLNVWNFRAVPNHPNYYLGCDTTGGCSCYVGINEPSKHNFNFNLFPNPTNGNFNISYLLPQNKNGKLEIFDVTGKCIYKMNLPQWSTLQQINLPTLSEGLYQCVITSGNNRISKKIAVINE